jgi:hydrogenase maturation protease
LSTLVLGIGNTLLSDEGIGVHIVHYLRERHGGRGDWVLLDGGTLSFSLLDDIARARYLVVVDAARLGAAPGTLRCFLDAEMDDYLCAGHRSVHEVGLSDLLDMARLSGALPRRRALIAIEPAELDWGTQPSSLLQGLIPQAASRVLAVIERWRQEDAPARDGSHLTDY